MKVVTLCSGGLDSVTLAYYIKKYKGWEQALLFVDYGQKHRKESAFALSCALDLGLSLVHVLVNWIGAEGMQSALTSSGEDIPKGLYAPGSVPTTVVPNRNSVFANLAASLAVSLGYDGIALAIHAGDGAVYPDTTPRFARALEDLLCEATGWGLSVYTPWVQSTKAEIIAAGVRMDVPFEKTWSCYEGHNVHCGQCGTCIERREAFVIAGVQDPTCYKGGP